MKLKSTEGNIYRIELTEEEKEQRTGMEGVPFEDCMEMLETPNTYIKYVCDYVNAFMLCETPQKVTPREHCICITAIIKDVYEVYKRASSDNTAAWFRSAVTEMINSNEFWNMDFGNKYIFDKG